MEKLIRSAKISFTIISGETILQDGFEQARRLWNFTWWCAIGHNRKLQKNRQGLLCDFDKDGNRYFFRPGLKGKLPPYPGQFDMQKELKDYEAYRNLSDRCSSNVIKEFDIAMRSWFSNLKSNPQMRPPRYCKEPRQLTFEIGRNAKSLGNWTYRLTVLGGHIPERHATIRLSLPPNIKMSQVKLIRLQPDFSGTIVCYLSKQENTGQALAAIDLGIINIATIAFEDGESIMVSGKGILASDQYYHKRASQCKPSGWQPGLKQEKRSKREIAYRTKAGNKRRLAIHNLTRFIIDECSKRGVGKIIIGDLKGIRKDKDWGKINNQWLHAWPYAEISRQLAYKTEEVNIDVEKINERGTSSHCHICGKKGIRGPRGLFTCHNCRLIINSDVNGAFGILNKVSPQPILACGVAAIFSGRPSPYFTGTGEPQEPFSQIQPTFVAKFDLRKWSLRIMTATTKYSMAAVIGC